MPVNPEKRQLENHVQGAIAAQFWSQEVQSTRCLAGKVFATPCEPQPLQITAPAGLSRTQLLIASHAVGLPAFPSLCGDHGGLVLDRVLLQTGDTNWWAAVTGRLKAQRMLGSKYSGSTLLQVLSDPNNYALAATTSIKVLPDTSLRATLHTDSLQHIPSSLRAARSLLPRAGSAPSNNSTADGAADTATAAEGSGSDLSSAAAAAPAGVSPATLTLQLKHKLDGLDLTADVALNELAADGVRRYSSTPLRMSVDLAPPSKQLQGLMYRVGLQGVVAPHEVAGRAAALPNSSSGSGSSSSWPTVMSGGYSLAVHMQAALALGGEHVLWKQAPAAAAAAASSQPQRQLLKVWPPPQPPAPTSSTALPGAAGGTGGGNSSSNISAAARDFASMVQPLTVAGEAAAASSSAQGSFTQDQQQPAGERHGRRGLHVADRRREAAAAAGGPSTKSSSSSNGAVAPEQLPYDPAIVTPIQIQDALQNSCASLERLRTEVKSLTGRVVEGGLLSNVSSSQQQQGPMVQRLMHAPAAGWSSFLGAPNVKVSGLVGVLARAPLHGSSMRTTTTTTSSSRVAAAGSSHSSSPAGSANGGTQQQQPGRWGSLGRQGSLAAAAASPARQLLAAGAGAVEQTQQLLRGTSGGRVVYNSNVRPFACGGISAQFGQLQRNFLDYTQLSLAADVGLTGPELHHHQLQPHHWGSTSGGSNLGSGGGTAGGGDRHPALALEQRGVWHALTLSATQQLVGPVRLRADWRWAVDSYAPCPRGSALLQPRAPLQLLQHVGGMRPSLVDSAYGVDVMVPGTSGLARLVAWWAPGRREGMVEVRLL